MYETIEVMGEKLEVLDDLPEDVERVKVLPRSFKM